MIGFIILAGILAVSVYLICVSAGVSDEIFEELEYKNKLRDSESSDARKEE